ncbi:DUF1097 domain-containing protein [Pseudoalteromonas carrageenovora]|uniref:DUF1097 domain-containing protein n=1 Tax=Pseudoalteromonas carrageenovora TaxID=227 RepID=UPI00311FBE14
MAKHYVQMAGWYKVIMMTKQTNTIQSPLYHVSYTAIAATIAAIAAATSAALQLPIWAMFIGWIAFFTQGLNVRHTITNLICVWLGITIGMIAGMALNIVGPILGEGALPFVVFIVAMLVVSLRSVPKINNLLCHFLGLVSFFASHYAPSMDNFFMLAGAASIGAFGGLASIFLQKCILSRA